VQFIENNYAFLAETFFKQLENFWCCLSSNTIAVVARAGYGRTIVFFLNKKPFDLAQRRFMDPQKSAMRATASLMSVSEAA